MGLIKAGVGALGGVLADQWKASLIRLKMNTTVALCFVSPRNKYLKVTR